MLKGFWKMRKGNGLSSKLKDLRWELFYAWQRAWKGYDEIDVFSFNTRFIERITNILPEFKKNNQSLFWDGKVDENGVPTTFNEEETNAIIQSIIDAFADSDEDTIIDKKYGGYDNLKYDEFNLACIEAFDNRHKGLELFTKYFDQLWW